MIYYIVNESFTNIMAFVSILFAFAFTIAAIALGKNLLPRDAGRAYAINGSKSVGKPRVTVFPKNARSNVLGL